MSVDTTKNTFWIYTGWSMFELVITKEDRDVWTLYLEKKQYDLALQYTKVYIPATCSGQQCFEHTWKQQSGH
jgi:hypothetical protein